MCGAKLGNKYSKYKYLKKKSCKVGVIATFACGIGGWGISRNVLLMDGCD